MGLEKIFLQLLNMSITAGYVIVAVFLIRLCIRRLPKVYSYILWSIVAFRLLCPISFSSAYSFFNLSYFEKMERTETGIRYVAAETTGGESKEKGIGETGADGPVMRNETVLSSPGTALDSAGTAGDTEDVIRDANAKEMLPKVFSVVWIAGMGILFGYTILEIIKIKRQTADAVLAEGNIYESDRIGQPFVFGIVHPRVYIPFRLGGKEREYILAHEQCHIRRKDYLVKGIAYGIAAVYWFHPLVWAAYYFMCQDMEMSCDEEVISSHGNEIKQSYGRLLLSFATDNKKLAGPLHFGESNAGKRIKNVLKFKKRGMAAAILGAALLVVLCLVFATDGQGGKKNRGTNSVMISTTEEQPILSSTIMPGEYVRGDFKFGEEIESYLVYADIYKGGIYEGRKVIVSHDMTAYEDGFAPLTGLWVDTEGGDTEGKQSSLVISYNTDMISRTSNIPVSEKATAEAGDILWEDGKSHEIQADTPYIYMARYIGFGDINEIECFRCENLNKADEEEWKRCIDQECITVLLYFVFSENPQSELLKEYDDARYGLWISEAEKMKQEAEEERRRAEEEIEEAEEAKREAEEERNRVEEEIKEAEEARREEEEERRRIEEEKGILNAELSQVMDRVVEKNWTKGSEGHRGDYTWNDFLMECKSGNEDILWEDHLIYFDATENGRADVYGVVSPEFGTKGIIIDYREKAGDDSNTNYFGWNWDASGFCPQMEMADFDKDGREEIFFRILGGKDPDFLYRERLFICETYETCTVVPYEFTFEMMDEEIANLLEEEVIEEQRRVKISEKGTERVLIPKLFYGYKGEGEFEKTVYSDWVWIRYDESTGDIFLAVKPTVYVQYDSKLMEGSPGRFTTEDHRLLEFKVRYDYSASLEGGYFTLSDPDLEASP